MDLRSQIYDELSKILAEYKQGSDMITEHELYDMLLKIQNNWEALQHH